MTRDDRSSRRRESSRRSLREEGALAVHRRSLDEAGAPGFVLVLGARRGGTSRFLSLLASHSEILSAGPTGIRYRARADFASLSAKVAERLGTPLEQPRCAWLADALTRGSALPDDPRPLLIGLRCRVIFLNRDPIETATRLAAMPGKDPAEAARKTAERFRVLAILAGRLAGAVPMLAVEHERAIARDPALLRDLAAFLGLATPFPQPAEEDREPARPREASPSSSRRLPPAVLPDLRAAGATFSLALGRIRAQPAPSAPVQR